MAKRKNTTPTPDLAALLGDPKILAALAALAEGKAPAPTKATPDPVPALGAAYYAVKDSDPEVVARVTASLASGSKAHKSDHLWAVRMETLRECDPTREEIDHAIRYYVAKRKSAIGYRAVIADLATLREEISG